MCDPVQPPAVILAECGAGSARFVDKTHIATVWQVRCHDGRMAALKVYHGDDMAGESHGFDFVEGLEGVGVAHVYWRNHRAALVEWLDGPSLGDLTRGGQDLLASRELVGVANRIHAAARPMAAKLPHLQDWFRDLFALLFGPGCPVDLARDITRCKRLAQTLLADQQDMRPLHGDLHHDNIRHGPRGYSAFDAKGVLGERAYELANAFRNPNGADAVVRDPARVRFLATFWAQEFGVDPRRLMAWAAIKCALSIAWRCGSVLEQDDEGDLLRVFLGVLDEAG